MLIISCGLLCTRATLVVRTVMLALLFTVNLMLVVVSVGVLPTLLLITLMWLTVVSLCIILVPLVGSILVCMLLGVTLTVEVMVSVVLWPLLDITMACRFRVRRLWIVVVVLGCGGLLKDSRLRSIMLAAFLSVSYDMECLSVVLLWVLVVRGVILMLSLCTRCLSFSITCWLCMWFLTLWFRSVATFLVGVGTLLCMDSVVTMVCVSGRLSFRRSVVVDVSSLVLLLLMVCSAVSAGRLLARALAPLKVMTCRLWAALRVLVLPTRTLVCVVMLALVTTVAGAVRFSVYG